MKYVALLAIVLALTGCGSTSDIVRAGPSTYMISSGGGIYTQNPSSMKEKVYKRANTYCGAMGKTMVPVHTKERPYALGRHTATFELTFTCK